MPDTDKTESDTGPDVVPVGAAFTPGSGAPIPVPPQALTEEALTREEAPEEDPTASELESDLAEALPRFDDEP